MILNENSAAAKETFQIPPIPRAQLRAASVVSREMGISGVTLWRWERRGWIKTVNICGKKYVDLQSLAEFERRAEAGEFAEEPSGAAGASYRARRALEERTKIGRRR